MRTNVPPARKCRNSSARKVAAVVQDKAAQAVGPVKAGPADVVVKAGPVDVVVKADAAVFVPRLIR